ncbi:MAG TPA: hypothetical protein VFC82_09935 [Actinomycetaceae bacterium]|nr:hypothetical protein [Actinomycetaceae bacterium]
MSGLQGVRKALAILSAVLAVGMLIILIVVGAQASSDGPGLVAWCTSRSPVSWLCPAPDGWVFALVFLTFSILPLMVWPNRRVRPLNIAVVLAVITIVLGIACYGPIAAANVDPPDPKPGYWVMMFAWVLGLFFGVLPDPPGTVTAPFDNLAFQTAAFTGFATLTVAAAGIVWALLRGQVHRMLADLDVDIDVVLGVDDEALDLARELKHERERMPVYPLWYRTSAIEKIRFRLRRCRSSVVVVHTNPDDPRLGEFRGLGCRVVTVPALDDTSLRRLAITRGRPAVRRFFAVTDRPAHNVEVVRRLGSLLGDNLAPGPFVPRLVALVDDPREAKQFRLDTINTCGYYVDALSIDELLARDIVSRIEEQKCSRVLIMGDSALGVAILDEIVLRRCFRHECNSKKSSRDTAPFPITETHVIDTHAKAQVEEWRQYRAPAADLPSPFALKYLAEDDWDLACRKLLGGNSGGTHGSSVGGAAVVIIGEPGLRLTAQALRISGIHDQALVFCPDARMDGVEPPNKYTEGPGRLVVSYGPTLLQDGLVPEDSWTVLARQNHAYFLADQDQDGRAAREHWLDARSPEVDNRWRHNTRYKEPDAEIEARLPRFYQDDNLHQQRQVMRFLAEGTCRPGFSGWEPVTAADPRTGLRGRVLTAALMDAETLTNTARAEHQRWCDKRLKEGWKYPAQSEDADDALVKEWRRRNANLWDWDTGQKLPADSHRNADPVDTQHGRTFDETQVRQIVNRLFWFGIAPAQ